MAKSCPTAVCAVALAMASLLSTNTIARADLSDSAEKRVIENIVVTATKREQTLQEIPVAVSVVDGELIENAAIVDIIDLQASVPSLRVNQLQTSSSTSFSIRGFGNGSNNPGIDPSVGVFVDGVFRSRVAASLFDFPTLERVEVLRGPQSTLFGKNVSVGAINIVTERPSFESAGLFEGTMGNLDTIRFRGTATGPLTDTLAYRLSGTTNNRSGTYTNVIDDSDSINERDRWSLRGQLQWEPSDRLNLRLITDVDRIDESCCGAVFLEQSPITSLIIGGLLGGELPPDGALPGDRLVAVDPEPSNTLDGEGVSLQIDYSAKTVDFTSITAFRKQLDENTIDADFTGADLLRQARKLDVETFTQELRFSGELSTNVGTFDWLAGGFYFKEDLRFDTAALGGADFRAFGNVLLAPSGNNLSSVEFRTQLIGELTAGSSTMGALFPELAPDLGPTVIPSGSGYGEGLGPMGTFDQDNSLFSAFFQADWSIRENLTLTIGLGYTRDEKEVKGDLLQTDIFQNVDLQQFASSGVALEAANLLGQKIGTPFNLQNPEAFFSAVDAASSSSSFEAVRAASLRDAQRNADAVQSGAATPSAFLAAGLGLTQLGAAQIFGLGPSFPVAGVSRESGITLSDDGYVVDDAFTYSLKVAYDLNDNVNGYLSYSTGYKPPASNLVLTTLPPSLATDGSVVGRFAGGEDVSVIELGLKAAYYWGSINLALFDQSVDDFQSVVFTGIGQQLSNAGEQTVRGVEIDASFSPTPALTLTFGATYLDSEFTSFVAAPCPAAGFVSITDPEIVEACLDPAVDTVDLSGTRPPGVHDLSVTAAASYEWELSSGAVIFPRLEYVYENDISLFEPDNGQAPTRGVNQLNANILFLFGDGFAANIWGRNLTDDVSNIAFFNSVAQAGSFNAYVVAPRQYGVSIRKTF